MARQRAYSSRKSDKKLRPGDIATFDDELVLDTCVACGLDAVWTVLRAAPAHLEYDAVISVHTATHYGGRVIFRLSEESVQSLVDCGTVDT